MSGEGECWVPCSALVVLTCSADQYDGTCHAWRLELETKVHTKVRKGTYKYDAIKRCQPLVWGNMTHDDASVETGVGGQAKYDVMMVFFGIALQKHHKTLKTSTRRYSDCHILHILNRYNK